MTTALETGKAVLGTVDSMFGEYDGPINLLPQLLGEDGKHTYLVMMQNPAELRSAGDMVGTIAVITAGKGTITTGDFATTSGWDISEEPTDDMVPKEYQIFGGIFDQYPATTTADPEFQRVAQVDKYV